MALFFTLLDILLTGIVFFDTLGFIYQLRKGYEIRNIEYNRLCLTWMFFLTLCKIFPYNYKGKLGLIFSLILSVIKLYVTIPKFNGTLKLYNILIEKGKIVSFIDLIIKIKKVIISAMHQIMKKFSNKSENINNGFNRTPS